MGAIREEDEEDEEGGGGGDGGSGDPPITDEDVAQAFSHWTYAHEGNEINYDGVVGPVLLCDVQGHFKQRENLFEVCGPPQAISRIPR